MSYEFANSIMLKDLSKIVDKLLGPTDEEKNNVICNSHFTLSPVDNET